jgi:hypothetical protein
MASYTVQYTPATASNSCYIAAAASNTIDRADKLYRNFWPRGEKTKKTKKTATGIQRNFAAIFIVK